MKPLLLSELSDVPDLSAALHETLKALYHSPLRVKPAFLCRLLRLHQPELTRMRWAHSRAQYRPRVSRVRLRRILEYLLGQFPTLVLGRTRNGGIRAHLYKYYAGKRLRRTLKRLKAPQLSAQPGSVPGSTRWFLQQERKAARRRRRAAVVFGPFEPSTSMPVVVGSGKASPMNDRHVAL